MEFLSRAFGGLAKASALIAVLCFASPSFSAPNQCVAELYKKKAKAVQKVEETQSQFSAAALYKPYKHPRVFFEYARDRIQSFGENLLNHHRVEIHEILLKGEFGVYDSMGRVLSGKKEFEDAVQRVAQKLKESNHKSEAGDSLVREQTEAGKIMLRLLLKHRDEIYDRIDEATSNPYATNIISHIESYAKNPVQREYMELLLGESIIGYITYPRRKNSGLPSFKPWEIVQNFSRELKFNDLPNSLRHLPDLAKYRIDRWSKDLSEQDRNMIARVIVSSPHGMFGEFIHLVQDTMAGAMFINSTRTFEKFGADAKIQAQLKISEALYNVWKNSLLVEQVGPNGSELVPRPANEPFAAILYKDAEPNSFSALPYSMRQQMAQFFSWISKHPAREDYAKLLIAEAVAQHANTFRDIDTAQMIRNWDKLAKVDRNKPIGTLAELTASGKFDRAMRSIEDYYAREYQTKVTDRNFTTASFPRGYTAVTREAIKPAPHEQILNLLNRDEYGVLGTAGQVISRVESLALPGTGGYQWNWRFFEMWSETFNVYKNSPTQLRDAKLEAGEQIIKMWIILLRFSQNRFTSNYTREGQDLLFDTSDRNGNRYSTRLRIPLSEIPPGKARETEDLLKSLLKDPVMAEQLKIAVTDVMFEVNRNLKDFSSEDLTALRSELGKMPLSRLNPLNLTSHGRALTRLRNLENQIRENSTAREDRKNEPEVASTEANPSAVRIEQNVTSSPIVALPRMQKIEFTPVANRVREQIAPARSKNDITFSAYLDYPVTEFQTWVNAKLDAISTIASVMKTQAQKLAELNELTARHFATLEKPVRERGQNNRTISEEAEIKALSEAASLPIAMKKDVTDVRELLNEMTTDLNKLIEVINERGQKEPQFAQEAESARASLAQIQNVITRTSDRVDRQNAELTAAYREVRDAIISSSESSVQENAQAADKIKVAAARLNELN